MMVLWDGAYTVLALAHWSELYECHDRITVQHSILLLPIGITHGRVRVIVNLRDGVTRAVMEFAGIAERQGAVPTTPGIRICA